MIWKEEFSVREYLRGRNANPDDYNIAYQHIYDVLESWNELKSIAAAKYEALGTIEPTV